MTPEDEARRDREHLNVLGVFHIVFGALGIVLSGLAVVQWMIMEDIWRSFGSIGVPALATMDTFGRFFYFVPVIVVVSSIALLYSGFQLRRYRGRLFSQCVAGLLCLFVPLGTVLGVFTLVVLSRPSTVRLYG